MKKIIYFLSLFLLQYSCAKQPHLELVSPDGKLTVKLENSENKLTYNLYKNDTEIILNSKISILQNSKVEIVNTKQKQVNKSWNPVWGQFSEINNHYNELEVTLNYEGVPATLFIRSYNSGLAFRFKVSELPKNSTSSFFIEYGLSNKTQLYSPADSGKLLEPVSVENLSQLDAKKHHLKIPLVAEVSQDKYVSILESDLISASGFDVMSIQVDKQSKQLFSKNDFTSKEDNFITPWRVILVEDTIGDLLINTVPLNVAAENKIKDPSWIKPGKTLWDWRVHGYTAKDGFTYGIDNESYYRFIDFAAENDIEYFMIDDAWYTHVEPGKMTLSEKLDLEKVIEYAKEKEVELLLYYDRRHGNYGDEKLFPYYKSLNMKGIKYGFMGPKVPFTRDAIRMSAESNLLIDFHDGPVPFTGVSRTYPNAITREFCHAQQDYRKAFTPKTFIRMALINALQGPLDMNNGIFDVTSVNAGKRQKGPKKRNSLQTTSVAETARTLIIFSGLVCIPDAPEAYAEKLDLFEFIKEMPVGKWDETKILHAKMDAYISTARRHGDEWFIGSVHSKGGTLDFLLDFLKENKTYTVTYYEDTIETNSKTNPEAYQVRTATVKKGDVVKANIVAGSGHCMWIRPE
ncbi:glycoside hydrolase family 97 protein [Polaribacter vadi]|uniref:glycoside hydrolase family 97 protein n=1 Tax=Polaribacter TaxID=52959 RepID=UPI001C0856B5|nr:MULTISPECIES: glycoside hydrolase family 97 protein [Polaribacter]MBU3011298.1 glycoside hydrolase family 97 protein [Polaribacter vadi]MDO6741111.1 glycoside hydrolase family 97 catalytic domain-containing protein [Polaribacter sp. 1_MG-2023]